MLTHFHSQRRAKRYEMDMTSGPILPKMLVYAGPLVLSGILQLLYNAADVIVVGRFSGAEALAAVGSTGALINLLINVFMGLSVGASVAVSHAYGAGDARSIRKGVHTAISLALISGVLVGALGVIAAHPMLKMMGSPDDVIDLAAVYVRIYFLGMPVNMLYTFGAAILRAVGDTRRPLYYLTLSGLVNVLLNLLLVIVFHLGVVGVAVATVTSQAISAALVLICLLRSEGPLRLDLKKLAIDREQLKLIFRIGLPAGLQGSLFSISNVLIQSSVNSFGSMVMAGNAASSSVEGFVYTSMNAVYQTAMTFCSQNMGAGKYRRVRRVNWVGQGLVITVGLLMGLLFMQFDTVLLSLYNSDPQVIANGLIRMHIILPTYFLCGMMDTMVGQLRGMGYSIMPMIVSLTGACGLRIVWLATAFATNRTLYMLYISYPISWFVTAAIHFVCYLIVVRRLPNEDRAAAEGGAA